MLKRILIIIVLFIAVANAEPKKMIISYKSNKFSLDNKQKKQIISFIKDAKTIKIIGSADKMGTETYNLILSARRTSNVRGFILTLGIHPNQIEAEADGHRLNKRQVLLIKN
jgi:outer membrane protein OmpA-like peptidoglycan-associated protein